VCSTVIAGRGGEKQPKNNAEDPLFLDLATASRRDQTLARGGCTTGGLGGPIAGKRRGRGIKNGGIEFALSIRESHRRTCGFELIC